MSYRRTYRTSEAVTPGHPDKVADQVSDAILDAYLREDPLARVAVETLVTKDRCVVAGEVTTASGVAVDLRQVVRDTLAGLGDFGPGFDARTLDVEVLLHAQSREIAAGVDTGGAGDQGIMYGYATSETPEGLPAPLAYARRVLDRLGELRRAGEVPLGPDGKCQVTMAYYDQLPWQVETLLVSHQHAPGFTREALEAVVRRVAKEVLPSTHYNERTRVLVNPSGSFVEGGPATDTGVTGRKLAVDTYGGAAPHGGGAFSGKDPSKVDRTGAYAARWLARNVVEAGLSEQCTVTLAYAIGVAEPVQFNVDLHKIGRIDRARLETFLASEVDLTPRGLRARLGLDRPIYARTAARGHFGVAPADDGGWSWERTDLADTLRAWSRTDEARLDAWDVPRDTAHGKQQFPRDWANLVDWHVMQGRTVLADGAVRALLGDYSRPETTHPMGIPGLDTMRSRFAYGTAAEILARIEAEGGAVVLLSCGSSLSAPAGRDALATVAKADYYAEAGASMFNNGYAGISVFDAKTRRRVAVFAGGQLFLRPGFTGERG